MNVICDTFGRGKVGLYSISGNGLDQGISTFSNSGMQKFVGGM